MSDRATSGNGTHRELSESIDCVLCDETSKTPTEHNQHMEEIHDC